MLEYKIEQLKDTDIPLSDVEDFLLKYIKKEYNLDYNPEYHKDIKYLYEYYINPERNNFYIATNLENNEIIGTIGIREYDACCRNFPNSYCRKNTASFYRVFVDKKYRRKGIASNLVSMAEKFCYNHNFNEIYLHTQKFVDGVMSFWTKQEFQVRFDSNNDLKTVHMDKYIRDI